MRGDCTSSSTVHYESCFNSTCSRSPSPVRRELWDPKYRQEKIKDHHIKNDSSLKALGSSKSRPRNKDRNVSPFHCRPEAGTHDDNGPRCDTDPFFSYAINGNDGNNRGTNSKFLLTIQKNVPRASPPSSRNKTPEPRRPLAQHQDRPAGNLTLQLELDATKNPPTVSISSKNSVISEAAPQIIHSAIPSAPSSTCTPCCHPCAPPSRASGTTASACQGFPYMCVAQPAAQPEAPCDATNCPSCPGPHQPYPKNTEDKATSPISGWCTPKELMRHDSPCQPFYIGCCPCHRSPPASNLRDRATSPIKTPSRPSSPIARVSFNTTPAHSRRSSAGSQGSIEIESDEGNFNLDWRGPVGPINVEVPISHKSRIDIKDDHIDSLVPQLEVFYPSSCNQSQSRSSPPSPLSPAPEWMHSRPAWNPCSRLADCCPSEKHSSSSTPWKSRSRSTTPSRTPRSRPPALRYSNDSPESKSALRMHDPHEDQPSSTFSWRNKPDDGWPNTCSTPRRPGCHQDRCQSHCSRSSSSPRVILTPRAAGNGQVTIQWDDLPSRHDTACTDCTPYSLYESEPGDCGYSRPPYHNVRENEEDEADEEYEAGEIRETEEEAAEFQDVEEDFEELNQPPETLVQDSCTSPSGTRCTGCCPLQPDNPPPCCTSTCASICGYTGMNTSCPPPNCNSGYAPQTVLDCCCDNCPYCCSGKYNCRTDLPPPVNGVNQCSALPPHLQSDWSASLRGPPNQLKTKPILYKDGDGHEHIMFADGSVEHLSHHCNPTPPAPAPQCSPAPAPSPPPPHGLPSPPHMCEQECLCLCDGDGDGGDGDGGHFGPPPQHFQGCTNSGLLREEPQVNPMERQEQKYTDFSPRSGDIVIRAAHRFPCLEPGKDDGKVAFYTSDYLDLRDRDSVVRLGKFDTSGKWCASRVVEMYMRATHGRWMFLGKHTGHECLRPLQPDQHQKVRTPSKDFQPRLGDLVISTTPGPNSFYFWNPKQKNLDCHHSQLLLRVFIGRPRVVDSNHNLACCVNGHLPVGYAELYVKVNSVWLFLGRDDHMFTEHELLHYP